MTMRTISLILMASLSLFSAVSNPKPVDDGEMLAYIQAQNAFVDIQAETPASDASLRWAVSLRRIAQSKSPSADEYLVKLALFKLDGEAGSEFSCAASMRNKRFAGLMHTQLRAFGNKNACRSFALARKLDAQLLCATKMEFARRVVQYRDVPVPDREGACTQ